MKTQTMKTKNKMMKSSRKNKVWLRNPDQMKTRKTFYVKMIRNKDGSFHIPGNSVMVEVKRNSITSDILPVDVRDFACELRNSKIYTF